jgi:hypothetical protein
MRAGAATPPRQPAPASGTGGFLVEAFEHLQAQAVTIAQRAT